MFLSQELLQRSVVLSLDLNIIVALEDVVLEPVEILGGGEADVTLVAIAPLDDNSVSPFRPACVEMVLQLPVVAELGAAARANEVFSSSLALVLPSFFLSFLLGDNLVDLVQVVWLSLSDLELGNRKAPLSLFAEAVVANEIQVPIEVKEPLLALKVCVGEVPGLLELVEALVVDE
jgi:hypothetical protein